MSAPDLDTGAVAKFLRTRDVALDAPLTSQLIAGGRSNLTYAITDGISRWVLRRPPTSGTTPSAHDMTREYRVTSALGSTDVPVAPTVALCEDPGVIGAPFTVVQFVEGDTIRSQDDLKRLDSLALDACVDGLLGAFASLHAVDYRRIGLADFGRADSYAARQLRRWSGQWDIVSTSRSGAAEQLLSRLREAVPDQSRASIVHGDFRIDNTLLAPERPGTVAAIVDWELSTIGDPSADVAMMCAYRHPALDLVLGTPAAWTSRRLPSSDALAARYESASGAPLQNWEFYLAMSFYKLAVIAQGIQHRHRAGASSGAGFDTAGDAVDAFLGAGLRHSTALRGGATR